MKWQRHEKTERGRGRIKERANVWESVLVCVCVFERKRLTLACVWDSSSSSASTLSSATSKGVWPWGTQASQHTNGNGVRQTPRTHTHTLFTLLHTVCSILLKPQPNPCPSAAVPCIHSFTTLRLQAHQRLLGNQACDCQTSSSEEGGVHTGVCICKGPIYMKCPIRTALLSLYIDFKPLLPPSYNSNQCCISSIYQSMGL